MHSTLTRYKNLRDKQKLHKQSSKKISLRDLEPDAQQLSQRSHFEASLAGQGQTDVDSPKKCFSEGKDEDSLVHRESQQKFQETLDLGFTGGEFLERDFSRQLRKKFDMSGSKVEVDGEVQGEREGEVSDTVTGIRAEYLRVCEEEIYKVRECRLDLEEGRLVMEENRLQKEYEIMINQEDILKNEELEFGLREDLYNLQSER